MLSSSVFLLKPMNTLVRLALIGGLLGGVFFITAGAGYAADARQVRFASLAALFYRYFIGAAFGEFWSGARDEANHPFMAALFGLPSMDILFGFFSADVPFFKDIYQEVSELLPQMA